MDKKAREEYWALFNKIMDRKTDEEIEACCKALYPKEKNPDKYVDDCGNVVIHVKNTSKFGRVKETYSKYMALTHGGRFVAIDVEMWEVYSSHVPMLYNSHVLMDDLVKNYSNYISDSHENKKKFIEDLKECELIEFYLQQTCRVSLPGVYRKLDLKYSV